ncbi:MBL fold metallo-hydrolase [Intestinimonas massiliensis (ex Afouda et al. 2020)]|uniref:MBL fold metallo-hydrolase n=1 Tax=Intestinimonas massiliensis (ex Afouda et al. 2020) TaxID=1673721 RepID=UPI00102FDFE5|nr:MBL fold metallo-hydrolase [Intestinimonas massiliensis (ex Afouda et al. 2020)]
MKIRVLQVGPIGTNCYLLEDETTNSAAIVDPGGEGKRILDLVQSDGMDVKLILLTHAHFDHTGGVAELHKALPDVPVYLHPADAELLGSQVFPAIGVPTVPYDEGDTLKLGSLTISVLHTPGHTPGGVCLKVGNALFTGDTLFQGSMGRTDFAGGSYEQIMASLKRLAALPGDYHVLPGHMGTSTLEAERKSNYYMQEAMG